MSESRLRKGETGKSWYEEKCKQCIHQNICESYDVIIGMIECDQFEEKRRRGEWIRVDKWIDKIYVGGFIHKECPMIKVSDDCLYAPWKYNFCPNCGAEMKID